MPRRFRKATGAGDYCECYKDVNGKDVFCDSCRDAKRDGSCGCCDAIIDACRTTATAKPEQPEIAILTGADGSKTTDIDSVGDLGKHLANTLVLPVLILGGVSYLLYRALK